MDVHSFWVCVFLSIPGPSVPPVWCVSTGRTERLPTGIALPALFLQSMLGAALHCTRQRRHGSGWVKSVCFCLCVCGVIRTGISGRITLCLVWALQCLCVYLYAHLCVYIKIYPCSCVPVCPCSSVCNPLELYLTSCTQSWSDYLWQRIGKALSF